MLVIFYYTSTNAHGELNEILTNLCRRKQNHRFQARVGYLHILADAKQENKGRNLKQPTYNENRPI